jgi:hypothetical protein
VLAVQVIGFGVEIFPYPTSIPSFHVEHSVKQIFIVTCQYLWLWSLTPIHGDFNDP